MADKFKIPTTPAEIVWVAGNVPPASDERWPPFSTVLVWENGPPTIAPITTIVHLTSETPAQDRWAYDDEMLADGNEDQEHICKADWWAIIGAFDTDRGPRVQRAQPNRC